MPYDGIAASVYFLDHSCMRRLLEETELQT